MYHFLKQEFLWNEDNNDMIQMIKQLRKSRKDDKKAYKISKKQTHKSVH